MTEDEQHSALTKPKMTAEDMAEGTLLAERAAAETGASDDVAGSLAIAEEWVRVYARNNAVSKRVRDWAIEELAEIQKEGWGQ